MKDFFRLIVLQRKFGVVYFQQMTEKPCLPIENVRFIKYFNEGFNLMEDKGSRFASPN